jgi:hypothetical protein
LTRGLKPAFILSSKGQSADFREILFPNGKNQVRGRIVGFLCGLCDSVVNALPGLRVEPLRYALREMK